MRTVRNRLSLILLPVFIASVILMAMDCHELTLPNHDCSICKLKNTFAGPFQKFHFAEVALTCRLPQDILYASDRPALGADVQLRPGRLISSSHADRAPPLYS